MAEDPKDFMTKQALHHLAHGGQVSGDNSGDNAQPQPAADPLAHMAHMQRIDLGEIQRQVLAHQKAAVRQARINFLANAAVIWGGNFLVFTAALWVYGHFLR